MKNEDIELIREWITLSRKLAKRLPRNRFGGTVVRCTNTIEAGLRDNELTIPGRYDMIIEAKIAAKHDHISY
jgi:hypothetical protein